MFRRGDAFWIRSQDNQIEHLHVVLSNPYADPERIVVVPLTTRDGWADETCVLRKGCHPAIKHDTCVDYRRAQVISAEQLDKALRERGIRKADPMPDPFLADILTGAKATWFLPQDCDRILVEQDLID